ncbi:MAG: sulfatase-like hydrolase/transferase [Planctomycetota bacterium]|nr:sulfatase-like hydrolase/transferase [Planctomycetota bacterium]
MSFTPSRLALLLSCLVAAAAGARAAQERPNFVFILLDDLGWGDVGCYGSAPYQTPRIDRMAAEGMRFTAAYANAPNCAPTRACLVSGQYSPRHGVYTVNSSARGKAAYRRLVPTPNTKVLPDGVVTLAEALGEAGYASACVGKWHLGDDPRSQGFDVSFGGDRKGHPATYFSPYGHPRLPDGPDGEYLTDRLTDEALEFVRAHREEPFFLYLSHFAVHTPVQAPAEAIERHELAAAAREAAGGEGGHPRYAAMIEALDANVGRLLDGLDALGLAEQTLVLLFSDNGGHAKYTARSPLRGSKGMLYEGGIREPLIARWPGRIESGSTCDVPVIGVDVYPTFLELAGVEAPEGAALDGESLAGLLEGAAGLEREAIFWHFPVYLEAYAANQGRWRTTPSGAVRAGRYKLLEFFEDGRTELFDLQDDPGESEDLAAAMPERAAALRARLVSWRESVGAPVPVERNPRFGGEVEDPPPPVSRGYSIPLIDLADESERQVVVDREEGQYLGHPTTVLLEDGATMIAVYPKGHGRGPIMMKRSSDGGRTWSERLAVPQSWATSKETPTIHRVVDREGTKRLILFSGLYPIRMAVSEDDGESWSELEPIGDYGGIVAMGCVERLADGDYLAMFHDDGRFLRGGGKTDGFMRLFQIPSSDGGLTWSEPRELFADEGIHLCEPGLVRSPDGKQMAVLLRENRRRKNSHVMFSDDEAHTWSAPRELPASLTGDRHTGRYAPDGRLFLSFRDTTHESPTKGDWVGWVGTYADIVEGTQGQYRVRLMDNHHRWDCAYPGVELLPDGTFVTTTYGHWVAGESPFVVSVRLRLEELDERARNLESR